MPHFGCDIAGPARMKGHTKIIVALCVLATLVVAWAFFRGVGARNTSDSPAVQRIDEVLAKPRTLTADQVKAEMPQLRAAFERLLKQQMAELDLSAADVDALATSGAELISIHRVGELEAYRQHLAQLGLGLPKRLQGDGAEERFKRRHFGLLGAPLDFPETRVRRAFRAGVGEATPLRAPDIRVSGFLVDAPGERGPNDIDVVAAKLDVIELSVALKEPRIEGRVNRFGVGYARNPTSRQWLPVLVGVENFVFPDFGVNVSTPSR